VLKRRASELNLLEFSLFFPIGETIHSGERVSGYLINISFNQSGKKLRSGPNSYINSHIVEYKKPTIIFIGLF
jgi:hypothetical protein